MGSTPSRSSDPWRTAFGHPAVQTLWEQGWRIRPPHQISRGGSQKAKVPLSRFADPCNRGSEQGHQFPWSCLCTIKNLTLNTGSIILWISDGLFLLKRNWEDMKETNSSTHHCGWSGAPRACLSHVVYTVAITQLPCLLLPAPVLQKQPHHRLLKPVIILPKTGRPMQVLVTAEDWTSVVQCMLMVSSSPRGQSAGFSQPSHYLHFSLLLLILSKSFLRKTSRAV